MFAQKTGVLASSHDRLREAAKALFADRGYESTTTAAICRLAGTSQSQLIKHYTNKQGLLDAIFEHAWEHLNPAVRLAIERNPSPKDKLRIVVDMVFNFLQNDEDLRTIFLLEGRRIRGDGHMVVLVPGFLDFVKILDGILKELHARGELAPNLHPHAIRSILMGGFEGLLRDQMLARTSRFPAAYSEEALHTAFFALLSSFMAH